MLLNMCQILVMMAGYICEIEAKNTHTHTTTGKQPSRSATLLQKSFRPGPAMLRDHNILDRKKTSSSYMSSGVVDCQILRKQHRLVPTMGCSTLFGPAQAPGHQSSKWRHGTNPKGILYHAKVGLLQQSVAALQEAMGEIQLKQSTTWYFLFIIVLLSLIIINHSQPLLTMKYWLSEQFSPMMGHERPLWTVARHRWNKFPSWLTCLCDPPTLRANRLLLLFHCCGVGDGTFSLPRWQWCQTQGSDRSMVYQGLQPQALRGIHKDCRWIGEWFIAVGCNDSWWRIPLVS